MSRFLKVAVKTGLQPVTNTIFRRKAFVTSRQISTGRQDTESSKTLTKDVPFSKGNENEGDSKLNDLASRLEQDSRILRRKLTDIDQFRRDMKSVGKEIFLANMDPRIFSYPDILPNDRYFELENKWKIMTDKLIEKEDIFEESLRAEGRPPKDLLFDLRKIGFYGFMCSTDYGGSALSYTEALRYQEELASFDLSLSEVISLPHTIAYKALDSFGTKDQKDRYLETMASGESVSALCFCESDCGSDFSSAKASTTMSDDQQYFILNGEKTWVCNGPSADVFLVYANHFAVTRGSSRPFPSVFLVERGFNGVKVHKENRVQTRGLHGVEICTVSFENTKIPVENVLKGIGEGAEVLTNLFHDQRLSASARMCGALRKLINYTVSHTLTRKAHGNPLSFYDVIKGRLSEAACYLYVLESAVYMTAGIADYQKVQDTNLESAMVKHFAIKASDVICNHCLEIFGASGYLQDSHILQLVNDLKAYSTWEGTTNILGFYIALTGLEYAGKCRAEEVDVMRNKGRSPVQALSIYKKEFNLSRTNPKLTLKLGDDLHYHLSESSDVLEELLLRFGGAIFQAMTREGYNLSLKELELDRIGTISSYIYVLASALARASRSFATGHPNSDFEMMTSDMFVSHTSDEIRKQVDLLFKRETSKVDSVMTNMSDMMIRLGRYPPVHPISKNTF